MNRRSAAGPPGPTAPILGDAFAALDPQAVVEAVESTVDLEAGGTRRHCTGRVLPLNSFENRVFQVDLEDAEPVVAKFYRPARHSEAALDEEHEFLFDLDEAGVPVATPLLLDADERSVGRLTVPGDGDAPAGRWHFALFERVRGRAPDELDVTALRRLGEHLGTLHRVGADDTFRHRPPFDAAGWARESLQGLLAATTGRTAVPANLRAAFEDTVAGLVARCAGRFVGVPTHRIHGDCHRGNLLWTAEGPVFLDFDDACVGPAVQDVWLLVPGTDAEARRHRRALLEGYRTVLDFEDEWLGLIEPLRALRYLRYAAWVAARFGEATFQRTFDHFGTARYWEDLLNDLREQRARIDHADGR